MSPAPRPAMAGAPSLSAILVIAIVVVVVAAWVALPAPRMLVATILAAILAILLAAIVATLFAATIPNRVGQHLDELDRRHGIVALDHQFARRDTFIGAVLDDDRKARAGPQFRRERIVEQLPAPAPALEAHAGHAERAVARIADREGPIGAAPAFTPPNVVEPATVSLPEGASPETLMLMGLAGSSLATVIVPALAPKLEGLNRIGTGRASPGPIVIG